MDPKRSKKTTTSKQARSQPVRPFYSQAQQTPFPNQYYSQPSPPQFNQPSPPQFGQPSPPQYPQPSTPQYYVPQPASPYSNFGYNVTSPPPLNSNLYNMYNTAEMNPFKDNINDEEVEFVADTQQPPGNIFIYM